MIIQNCESLSRFGLEQLEKIFFDSSSVQSFKDAKHKREFQNKYLNYYIETYPKDCFIAREGQQVLAYILCCPDTLRDSFLLSVHPHLKLFEEYYKEYPAHLHINASPVSRGKGVGSQLIQALLSHLSVSIHLITAEGERNIQFYLKNDFKELAKKEFKGAKLLLLGN